MIPRLLSNISQSGSATLTCIRCWLQGLRVNIILLPNENQNLQVVEILIGSISDRARAASQVEREDFIPVKRTSKEVL
jgi:hypothetical protein